VNLFDVGGVQNSEQGFPRDRIRVELHSVRRDDGGSGACRGKEWAFRRR
jgi:hypothetical protein